MKDPTNSLWKLPVLSGLLLVLAYFPWGLLVPNFVAFLPMLWWLDANRDARLADRLRAGLFFGLTVHILILHWMMTMLDISWLWTAVYAFMVAMFSLGVMVSVALAGWIRRRTGWSFVWILPACWLPVEWSRTWGDLRMTADHVGHTLAGYPFLIQFVDLVGPYGVGAFMLIVNALIYETIRGWKHGGGRRALASLAGLLLVVLAYDGWAWTHPPESGERMRVAIVQPNIPLDVKSDLGTADAQWQVLERMTREAAARQVDLVVWPESARPRPVFHWLDIPGSYVMADVQQLATEAGVSILTGVEYYRIRAEKDYELYNAAMIVYSDGTLDPVWTAKVYLVPFTEGIPFERFLGPLLSEGEGELQWMAGGFTPGPAATNLPFGEKKIGVLVCYEELYPDLPRLLRNDGADLQVVITNDAWFGRTVFQAYQANTVRMRAIENRSSIVRVANTGISGFVDPLGRYDDWTDLFVEALEIRDVALTSVRTVYNRSGDVVAWIALVALPAMILFARSKRGIGSQR